MLPIKIVNIHYPDRKSGFLSVKYIGKKFQGILMPERQSHHKKFVSTLSPEEKILVVLRDELYDGSWDKMLKDLEDRLKQRPYIFKLVSRINEDIARIKKLQKYEKEHNINLKDFLKEK